MVYDIVLPTLVIDIPWLFHDDPKKSYYILSQKNNMLFICYPTIELPSAELT